jgi:hypothetical protein
MTGTLHEYYTPNTRTAVNLPDENQAYNAIKDYTDSYITSAGNYWTATPSTPLSIIALGVVLGPGTYTITPYGNTAYNFATFDWDTGSYRDQYQWLLQIVYSGTQTTLGADTLYYNDPTGAFANIASLSTTITLSAYETVYFYIWDDNSVDNGGSLSFNIASVPLPSSLLLVLGGLPALALFRVRRFFSEK